MENSKVKEDKEIKESKDASKEIKEKDNIAKIQKSQEILRTSLVKNKEILFRLEVIQSN